MQFIHSAMSEAAAKFPDRTAVWSDSGAVTYRELDARSSTLAAELRARGAGPGERVAIMLQRTADAVIAIFAALKSGAAYVPIDPAWPECRVEAVLNDCRFRLLIAHDGGRPYCRKHETVMAVGSAEWNEAVSGRRGHDQLEPGLDEEDIAYVLYTSGSTGVPKGVCLSHRAAGYFADWARAEFEIGPGDRVAAVSPFTFDLSTFDLFSGLASGASVFLAGERVKMLPSRLSRFLEEHGISVIYAVPSTLRLMAARGLLNRRDLNAMRLVLFAGEVFAPKHVRLLMQQIPERVRYFNLYGPTETNVCTCYALPGQPPGDEPIPIGQALPGTTVFAVPAGEGIDAELGAGELCVSGPGVMSGYWGERENDASHWVEYPPGSGRTAYRTGDLAEQRPDGNWMYHGRKDGMVKIWGYRVELAEIEGCLLAHPAVEHAVAVKAESPDKEPQLEAYVVWRPDAARGNVGIDQLLKHCRARLPHYMMPHRVRAIDSIPVTDSGKADRRRLAEQAARQ